MQRSLAASALLFSASLVAQDDMIRNSMGTDLGSRSEFMAECIKEMAGEKELAIFRPDQVCECMLTTVLAIPAVDRATDPSVFDELDFDEAMESAPEARTRLEECMTASMLADVPVRTMGPEALNAMIQECTVAAQDEASVINAKVDAQVLCKCMFEEVYRRDLTMAQVQRMQDENSVEFNEIAIPCLSRSHGTRNESTPRYAGSPDVTGKTLTEQVPLVALGKLHKVKVTVGGQQRYWIIDSGASDPIINSTFANELRNVDFLTEKMRLEAQEYTLADGRTVLCERYMVQNVLIGDFTVANVIIAVLPEAEGQFLLGKSFLDKFTEWRIDARTSKLHLKRG